MADATEVNAAAWVSMLRAVWNARPSLAGARAVLSMCTNMLGTMNAAAGELSDDHFTRSAMKSWHEDFDIAVARLNLAADGTSLAFVSTQPSSIERIVVLTAHAMGPVLDGQYPIAYADAAACMDAGGEGCSEREILLRKGLTKRADGTFKGMGVAFDIASLWNRLAAARTSADLQSGLVPDFVAEWLTQAEHQLSEAAPGEAPTVYDDVGAALEAAKQKVADVGRAIGTKLLVGLGIGLAVVLGGYLLFRDR